MHHLSFIPFEKLKEKQFLVKCIETIMFELYMGETLSLVLLKSKFYEVTKHELMDVITGKNDEAIYNLFKESSNIFKIHPFDQKIS